MPSVIRGKLPRREGLKVAEKTIAATTIVAATTTTTAPALARVASTGAAVNSSDAARRHQRILDDEDDADPRGGPRRLEELQLRVLAKDANYIVLNKHADHRLDGAFEATIEKALHRDYPEIDKFRWIHQLDFATSGVLAIGLNKAATSLACRLFRDKRVQKEYLAVVRGHLPFNPQDVTLPPLCRVRACAFSKLGLLIQDTEEFERLKTQLRGTTRQQKDPAYPRGVRQAPGIFQVEKNALLKLQKSQARALTVDELTLLGMNWGQLPAETKAKYQALMEEDKLRYKRELLQYLDNEFKRVAGERQYDQPCTPKEQDDGTQLAASSEPIAYVFDDPIAEPDKDAFRMQIGDRNKVDDARIAGKASTTIAFVLGHGMYENEAVTKVLLRPLTGRRHQLRLHLAHNGFPILGDATYASENETAPRMMLHAWRLWLMAPPKDQAVYGDLYFSSPDPFEDIVESQREITTIAFDKTKGE